MERGQANDMYCTTFTSIVLASADLLACSNSLAALRAAIIFAGGLVSGCFQVFALACMHSSRVDFESGCYSAPQECGQTRQVYPGRPLLPLAESLLPPWNIGTAGDPEVVTTVHGGVAFLIMCSTTLYDIEYDSINGSLTRFVATPVMRL